MFWRVEVREKPEVFDALGESVHKSILDLRLTHVQKVHVVQVYIFEGDLKQSSIERIASLL